MKSSIFWFFVAFILIRKCSAEEQNKASLECIHYSTANAKISLDLKNDDNHYEDEDVDEPSAKPAAAKVEKCAGEENTCFSIWRHDKNGSAVIKMQGCWHDMAQNSTCGNQLCIGDRNKSIHSSHYFCCCNANSCNANHTESTTIEVIDNIPLPTFTTKTPQNLSFFASMQNQKLLIIVLIIIAPLIVSILYVAVCRVNIKENTETTTIAAPNPKYCADMMNVDNLKLCSLVGQGKYGTVWKGMINEETVAVKIFPAANKEYFLNERDIYTLPLMETPNFLEYFGYDERRNMDGNMEYLLVLSLAPLGCLQDWLRDNTSTFNVFINMSKSIAKGLSHLHSEVTMGAMKKPCVVHRDINSRNILVNADMTCCISDFGFALKTFGSCYEWRGEIVVAEQKSMNEVGTMRYLAPELLEGAVNLRDCETSLKQADIYALGLVMWELCTRCQDFYSPGQATPSYKLPYETEVGNMPSFEQMQVLISRQKVRPRFPVGWGGDTAAKIARDTIEDCVDHDAEARLTALCVEERLREMSTLRPHSIILSPTAQRSVSDKQFNYNLTLAQEIREKNAYPTVKSENSSDNLSTSDSFNRSDNKIPKIRFTDSKFKGLQTVKALISGKKHNENDDKVGLVDDKRHYGGNRDSLTPSTALTNESVPIKAKHLPQIRPSNLNLTMSHSSLLSSENNSPQTPQGYQSMLKRQPGDVSNQQFSIVDDSARSERLKPCIVVSKSANAVKSLQNSDATIDEWQLKRQRSLEVFRDVFGVKGSIDRLRDPSERIKTPGDVPKSVRKVRASKTLSLYDDRMMNGNTNGGGNTM